MRVEDDGIEYLSSLFQLLGDPVRLRILSLLVKQDRTVSALCEMTGLPQPTVSHHLSRLRAGELVRSRRKGRNVINSICYVSLDTPLGVAWCAVMQTAMMATMV